MIDRYAIYSDFATIVKRYALKGEEFTVPNYNAAPAQQLPLISNISKNEVSFYYWGINKEWSNNKPIAAKLLSAPKDQLLIRTTLMNALTKRRCLIPVNGFYLWKQYSKKGKPLTSSLFQIKRCLAYLVFGKNMKILMVKLI